MLKSYYINFLFISVDTHYFITDCNDAYFQLPV